MTLGGRVGVVNVSVLHEKNGASVSDQVIRSDEGLPKNVLQRSRSSTTSEGSKKKTEFLVFTR